MATCFTTPILEKTTKGFIGPRRCLNAKKVNCWDGGFVAEGADNSGHHRKGFAHVALVTSTALPLAIEVHPYQEPEKKIGVRLVEDFTDRVLPHLDPDKVCVLSADGGFNSPKLRPASRGAGIIENCHPQTHTKTEATARTIEEYTTRRIPIEPYPNWTANLLREISCRCGRGKTQRRMEMHRGRAVARVIGRCKTCGDSSITSGEWRFADNPDRFVHRQPGDPQESVDLLMGNPLTYNDRLSKVYGHGRFGHNEGYNSSLANRFGIAHQAPRRLRSRMQAEIESYGVAIAMHTITMQYRRITAAPAATSPPPVSVRAAAPAATSPPPVSVRAAAPPGPQPGSLPLAA
jgi:hypothetical protein